MEPGVFLAALLIFIGIPAFTVLKIVRLRTERRDLPPDVTARIEALESGMQDLQEQLGEAQERLDFAERMLSKARDDKRIGG